MTRLWVRFLPHLLLALLLGVFLWRFTYSRIVFLSFFTDDFFYYLIVAKNLAFHGASTFNGITPTNGYHPLWLLTLTLLVRLLGDHPAFFIVLMLLIWLLVCGTYVLLRRLQGVLGIIGGLGLACALFSTTFMASISRTGMEISLALFFLVLLWYRLAARPLESQSTPEAMLSGLIAAAAILSRLDAALVVGLYLLLTLFVPSTTRRSLIRSLTGFALGLLPVAIYVAVNIIDFHTFLPVSGMAKNLKPNHFFSPSTILSLFLPRAVQILFVLPSLAIAALFVVRRLRSNTSIRAMFATPTARVQFCILLHPILFYAILSFTSDWPLWTWYFYPLVPVAALLGPEALSAWSALRRPGTVRALTATTVLLSIVTAIGIARPNAITGHMNHLATHIQDFALTHPGRYAMGDASGTPAYLIPQPFLQLEGLMGDRDFLDRIRHRQPLTQVLSDFAIDYYVSNAAIPSGNCFDVDEPNKAGPKSPTLPGHLCLTPVARFEEPTLHDVTIFDVRSLHSAIVVPR